MLIDILPVLDALAVYRARLVLFVVYLMYGRLPGMPSVLSR